MFRFPRFKQFLDAGQALRDVVRAGNAARVERAHGQLRARFADSLGRDGADCFPDVDLSVCCQVAAVALAADAKFGFAGQDGTDLDDRPQGRDFLRHGFRDVFVDVVQNGTVGGGNVLCQGA